MRSVTRRYTGRRTRSDAVVLRHGAFGSALLNPCWDLRNHSPDGFEWGYGGSGPAQLALAILADATGDDALALRLYHDFKWQVIAAIKTDTWELTREQIAAWLATAAGDA